MTTISIPKNLIKEKELILIPRKEYNKFLHLQEMVEKRKCEEKDIDLAIKVYKKEKRQGKLKETKSLVVLR